MRRQIAIELPTHDGNLKSLVAPSLNAPLSV